MDRAELARRLTVVAAAERTALLARYATLADVELAWALKALYDASESSDPLRAADAAAALKALSAVVDHPEVGALSAWTAGMVALDNGQMEMALAHLDEAEARFKALEQPHTAAATRVSKLIALALLGRYDEAIQCGLQARDLLVAHGDTLAAGKIEQNLGNIYFRRDRYHEAEQFYRAARERFTAAGDQKLLVIADNGLANVLAWKQQFRDAAQLYEEALARAEAAGLEIMQAAIECNLGSFALDQGRYDRALDYLERSRRRYAALGMPHESAIAELELADAYLELNLAPEAAAIYARVTPIFARLGMRAEQARAVANHAHACLLPGRLDQAQALLAEARTLYLAEGNAVGAAMVTLTTAQLHHRQGNYSAAATAAAEAEATLASAGAWGRALLARWLRGDVARASGQARDAQSLLEATLRDAGQLGVPQIALRCHASRGWLALAAGDLAGAEESFEQAVMLIEALRAPLPAEEFRTAFVADKLAPYAELVRLCLADPAGARAHEALRYVERARARALMDLLDGAGLIRMTPRDTFEAALFTQLDELREELNWLYSQINRPPDDVLPRSAAAMAALHEAVRQREAAAAEITRQLQQRAAEATDAALPSQLEPVDIARLQRALSTHTAIVEYFSLDGEFIAFVVTDAGIEVVRHLGHEDEVLAALEQLRYQIDTLRLGTHRLRKHLGQLTQRARHYLRQLYDLLLRPVEGRLGERRLVVVPHRALYYVPFHALDDETGYVIERREVCYAPSASILWMCLAQPQRPLQRALILGVPDQQTPHIRDEVQALAPLFPESVVLLDEAATVDALRDHAPAADLLHLACHGQFRPDNPLFSSLRLVDGWLTVRDAYNLDLRCQIITLSACETGVGNVAPGDELIGMARGFFSTGVPSLLVSLWTVDDATTATLMACFYNRIQAGDNPARALRRAQCELLEQHPHAFFWSPFILFGRW